MNDPERTGDYQPGGNDERAALAVPATQPQHIGRYRIEKVLGQGGFGLVYLAHDDQLQRLVAIKVPHRKLVDRPEAAEAYLTEARTVANLDHAHIVPVFDVGSSEDCPCYVVSKYIDGTDLATRLEQSRLSIPEAVELVAIVAEALHHAHKQGLVHRDIKPGNILLDRSGKPFVADFGLALREQDVGKGPRYAGTPAYMSPEQARGEGHRVDGRSDLFSLGVVFYELLVGRQPFRGQSQAELMEQVTSFEARPPRQCDDGIPRELDRICLKALSKRASERYSTAKDMADDLRHFQAVESGGWRVEGGRVEGGGWRVEGKEPSVLATRHTPPITPFFPSTPHPPPSTLPTQPIKIVPKGLRSFDAHDADFFLELLPGPRDREGLPDSLRFWKTRIEEKDADNTFTVGLIYGPSGCGKSSLVKAGLLPRLSDDAIVVYLEATAADTEVRLLSGLRKKCPALPDNLGLKEALAALRRGQGIPVGKKVLIVLDQLEQWLHARKEEENSDLVGALRQCDGGRLQCIVMVRDDFWMAATRFMRELEVRLVEGQNSTPVDLFPIRHAEKVLAAFGRAFGVLPDNPRQVSMDQKHFMERAVAGLAQEGKVISVRLALFAEMMKGKAWTSASLKAAGGTEGVGVTFLEETFSADTAPPEHRYHQKAARAVLKILLPETGSDIKGHMRSYAELLEASGYGSRPKDFDDLIRILDNEIRLITPTDPEGVEGGEWRVEGKHDNPELPTAGGLAVGHGIGGEVLPGDQGVSQSGAVWPGEPNPESCGVDPSQYRGGAGAGAHQGVSEPPEHGTRIFDGAGNAPVAQPARGVAAGGGAGHALGAERSDKPNAQRPAQGARTAAVAPSTLHPPPSTRYYQLTHDYLVHSIREWLTRKQKETRRGRAELLLADRAAVWNARPENRQLPSLLQWLTIRWWTQKKSWAPPQKRMMAKAGRYHAVRGLVVLVVLALVGWGGYEGHGTLKAHALRDRLLDASTNEVPTIVQDMGSYRRWINPLLHEAYVKAEADKDARKQLHASLALLPVDGTQVTYLHDRLLGAELHEVPVIRDALAAHKDDLLEKLWAVALKPEKGKEPQRLRAAAALAKYDPESDKWARCGPLVVSDLVLENPIYLGQWSEAFRPVKKWLLAPLAGIFRDRSPERASERTLATNLLADYAGDQPQVLADLLMDADEKQLAVIYPKLKDRAEQGLPLLMAVIDTKLPADLPSSDARRETLAKRQANAAVALLRMNQPAKVWPLLKHSPDPRVRSYLIHRLGPLGADAGAIVKQLDMESDLTIRRALVLSLGEYGETDFTLDARSALLPKLQEMYRTASDPGLHAACEWLLRRWKQDAWLTQVNEAWAKGKVAGGAWRVEGKGKLVPPPTTHHPSPGWYVNTQGQTFVVIPGPVEFTMGSPLTEKDRAGNETQHRKRIGRTFALATMAVTKEQFLRFQPKFWHGQMMRYPEPTCPIGGFDWYAAVAYCNWLSKEEGIPEDQWCYEIKGNAVTLKAKYLSLWGYRLPTEAEMEYAARAGALTSRYYGETDELLPKYAWYFKNSQARTWPVGSLKPNDLGLFDVQGNLYTWCQERHKEYPAGKGDGAVEDQEDELAVISTESRVLRGGCFHDPASHVRSAYRDLTVPTDRDLMLGFRLARTLPLGPFRALRPTAEGGRK